jgi:hypothetical protein
MTKATAWYAKALAAAEEADAKRAAAAGDDAAAAAELDASSFKTQALIMEGNVLYEWSQLLAAVGAEWKGALDSAVDKFKAAKCSEGERGKVVLGGLGLPKGVMISNNGAVPKPTPHDLKPSPPQHQPTPPNHPPAADVRSALKNHSNASDLDLGPDPEEEAAAAKAAEEEAKAAAAKPEAAKAKGLPSLGKKK